MGKNSTTGKLRRLTQELVTHTCLAPGLGHSLGFSTIRLEYAPFLRDMLLKPLLDKSADGVHEVKQLYTHCTIYTLYHIHTVPYTHCTIYKLSLLYMLYIIHTVPHMLSALSLTMLTYMRCDVVLYCIISRMM